PVNYSVALAIISLIENYYKKENLYTDLYSTIKTKKEKGMLWERLLIFIMKNMKTECVNLVTGVKKNLDFSYDTTNTFDILIRYGRKDKEIFGVNTLLIPVEDNCPILDYIILHYDPNIALVVQITLSSFTEKLPNGNSYR